jgi:hypothetical protein
MAVLPDMEAIAELSPDDRQAVTDDVMNTAAVVMMDKEVAVDMIANEWTAVAH